MFGAGRYAKNPAGKGAGFRWQSGDQLLLVSACPEGATDDRLTPLIGTRMVHELFADLDAMAGAEPGRAWLRHGAVALIRCA